MNQPRGSSKRRSGRTRTPFTCSRRSPRSCGRSPRGAASACPRPPPPAYLDDAEVAALRVVPVHVRDLELAPARRPEVADHVEDVGGVAVEADDGVRGRRRVVAHVDDAGLLDDVGDAAVLAVDDDAEVLGIRHLLDEDPRAGAVGGPAADLVRVRVLEDVVAEHDHERVAAGEVPRHPDDLRDPAGLGLHLVGEVELQQRLVRAARRQASVPEQVDHLPRVALAGDDEHLVDPGQLEQLQRVVDHRPAADREQVLVRDPRQLPEPRRLTTRADESLRHARDRSPTGAPGGPARARRRSRRTKR